MKFNFYVLYILFAVFTIGFSDKATAQMPVLQWGTYYGGAKDDFGNSVVTDKFGNVYVGGRTKSSNAISTFPVGIVISDSMGFVAKFNSSGVRQWGTYIRGEVNDLACDAQGNVYVVGSTIYTNIISTPGSHQFIYGGGLEDGFLIKLNPSGNKVWGTYYGGSEFDFINSVTVDVDNNVYIAGVTNSIDRIGTLGAQHLGSKPDATNDNQLFLLAKFSSDGTRVWGTYFGSDEEDESFGNLTEPYSINVATDLNRNVYIAGSTVNNGFATPGVHKFTKSGDRTKWDGFVARFSPSGALNWSSYYGGAEDDFIGDITCDLAGGIYVSGITKSPSGIASAGGSMGTYVPRPFPLDYNMMLAKLNSSGMRDWGRYHSDGTGTPALLYGMSGGLAIDPAGYIYLVGAKSNNPNAPSPGFGSLDAELSRFDPTTGSLDYDTIIGGPTGIDFDFGAAIAVDQAGNVYIAGSSNTLDSSFISTPSAHQRKVGAAIDAFLIKFKNSDTTVYFKDLHLLPTTFCLGDTFRVPYGVTNPFKPGNVFTVQLYNIGGHMDLGSLASSDSGSILCTIPNPLPTPPLANPLKIRIITSDPSDTTVANALLDTISSSPVFEIVGDSAVCQGTPVNLRVIPQGSSAGFKYLWNGPQGFTANTAITVVNDPTPDNSGYYVATVSAGGCKVMDSLYVKVKPRPDEPEIFVDSIVCEKDTLFLRAMSNMPQAGYHWNGPNGLSQGSAIPETYVLNITLNGTGLYYVAAGIGDCYSDTVSTFVRVKPIPNFQFLTDPVCEGDTLRIRTFTDATDSVFMWFGPNGHTSFDTNVVIPGIPYDSRGTYVLAAGRDGCIGFGGVEVVVHPKPKFMATSNSPIFEGEDLKLDIAEELFPGASFKWVGPARFRDSVRSPARDSVDADLHSGNYHVTATSVHGCKYVGITNVIIYKLNYDEFTLYPIPNNGNFKVKGTVRTGMPINVEISNSANQLIGYDVIYPQQRKFEQEYRLEDNLANGQYYFRAKVNGKWKVVPFTITK